MGRGGLKLHPSGQEVLANLRLVSGVAYPTKCKYHLNLAHRVCQRLRGTQTSARGAWICGGRFRAYGLLRLLVYVGMFKTWPPLVDAQMRRICFYHDSEARMRDCRDKTMMWAGVEGRRCDELMFCARYPQPFERIQQTLVRDTSSPRPHYWGMSICSEEAPNSTGSSPMLYRDGVHSAPGTSRLQLCLEDSVRRRYTRGRRMFSRNKLISSSPTDVFVFSISPQYHIHRRVRALILKAL
ncbi:hypothetical protein BC628DRAFT_647733 [Trametes gibbosa]|nr:hypothetical protein BC628DRAFT_647733 [Trametes gibbosa]